MYEEVKGGQKAEAKTNASGLTLTKQGIDYDDPAFEIDNRKSMRAYNELLQN